MHLIYTEQALNSLEEVLDFLASHIPEKKVIEIRNKILDKADALLKHPHQGHVEPYLRHLNLGHRSIVEIHYKMVYRIIDDKIYITDIFDSRQEPGKMQR
jgi:plasmid stabilization system protein ParE